MTLNVVYTFMPLSSNSSMSWYLNLCLLPELLLWANSSMITSPGERCNMASISISPDWLGRIHSITACLLDNESGWKLPKTTSRPFCLCRYAFSSIAWVLPSPMQVPKKIVRSPCFFWESEISISRLTFSAYRLVFVNIWLSDLIRGLNLS